MPSFHSGSTIVATEQSRAVESIVRSGSHTRDSRRSSLGWESRQDGQLVKRDYYQLQQPTMAKTNSERGIHILGNIFTGSYALAMNETWLREKNIDRVLVLGRGSGVSVVDTMKLRVVDIDEGSLESFFDTVATLITECSNENANVLIVDRDGRTFNPAIIVAHLLSLGWTMDAAVRRIEGIYRIVLSNHQFESLRRWDQTLGSRRTEIATCESRSRCNSVQSVRSAAPSIVSTLSSCTSMPAISAMSVINPMYYATNAVSTFAAPMVTGPAIGAVSVVNPYWNTLAAGPMISAQSVINPYWDTISVTTTPALPVVHPVIHPIIHAPAPAISAVSLVNPYWNQTSMVQQSVVNPVWNERHVRTEIAGRIEAPRAPAPAWNARSQPVTSSEYVDVSSNPLARFPRASESVSRYSSGNSALADAVETTALRRARSIQRGPGSAYEPAQESHYVRDITAFG